MRKVLMGAVESTATALRVLHELGSEPVALFTLPNHLSSRHSDFVDLRPLAASLSVPVLETDDCNSEATLGRLRSLRPDLLLVIGWSQICRARLREVPTVGCIGFHPSALPHNRGRAVIPWTILQGTDSTGSSLFWLSEGADEGDLIGQELFSVAENETARTLMDKHLAALEKLLLSLTEYEQVGQFPRVPQDSCQATLCFRRTPEDGRINWLESANAIERLVRATGEPYPGAFAYNGNKMLRIWDANVVDRSHYWAVSGQIVEVDRGGPILRCASNTHLQLTRLSYDDGGDFEARVGARLA